MISELLNQYLEKRSKSLSPCLQTILQSTNRDLENSHMACGQQVAALLSILVKLMGASYIVDIGTYTGFSALTLAEACSQDGKIYSCENNQKHFEIAKKNIEQHPLASKIELCFEDASNFINQLEKGIDLAFLDANKSPYLEYYSQLVDKVKKGGLIVVDDALWKGLVASPTTPRLKKMDQFNKFVLEDSRVENILLPIRNGINLIYKL